MHNAGIHFEHPKRRSISLTKTIADSMKWYTGHTFSHVYNNNYINYNAAMFGLKILFNHAMETFSYYRFTLL